MSGFKTTDKRHTPASEPEPTITDFIEARRTDLLTERGQDREYRNARGEPCPLPDCDRPIDGAAHDGDGRRFVFHYDARRDVTAEKTGDIQRRTRHEVTREQFESVARGDLTADAKFARRLVEAIPFVLDDVLAYEMSLDIERGSGQGRADPETVDAVRAIAAIWRDHPDYNPAWRLAE